MISGTSVAAPSGVALRRCSRALLVVAGAVVAGCTAIPPSTMARLGTFDETDFSQLDARDIRVRVVLPQGYLLDARRSALGVRIVSAAGVHDGTFALDTEARDATRTPAGVFSRGVPATAYTLRLAPASRERFRDLQAFVARARPEDISLRVMPRLAAFPLDAASVRVWVDLLFEPGQGWFRLLDAAELPLDRARQRVRDGAG